MFYSVFLLLFKYKFVLVDLFHQLRIKDLLHQLRIKDKETILNSCCLIIGGFVRICRLQAATVNLY